MNEEIEQLKRDVAELKEWKTKRELQQISRPLDPESIAILNEHFLSIVDEYIYFGGASGNPFLNYVAIQGDKRVDLEPGLIRYTADASTDYITIVDKIIMSRFENDQAIRLYTTNTAPAGLNAEGSVVYYIASASSDGMSFKVRPNSPLSAVANITDSGTGRQLLAREL